MKKSSMFLLELLAMVLVFSLCATVCVRLIGASWRISQESERLTQAVYLAESVAAQLQSGDAALPTADHDLTVRTEAIDHREALLVTRIYVECEGKLIYSLDVTTEEATA